MSRCRSCLGEITWARTESGKRIPLDAEPVDDGNVELTMQGVAVVHGQPPMFDPGPMYVSHFATCPNANEHRSKPA